MYRYYGFIIIYSIQYPLKYKDIIFSIVYQKSMMMINSSLTFLSSLDEIKIEISPPKSLIRNI